MELENQYLTYNEYQSLGGTLEETPFNLLEFKARMYVDKYTFGRLKELENQSQETKLCINELINELKTYSNDEIVDNNSTNKNIASESIDGYSISYANNLSSTTQVEQGKEIAIQNIINTYLATSTLDNGTPYLYRG